MHTAIVTYDANERLDDFFQVGALAFRAVYLLRLVFLDGQHFAKFFMALAADVFVKGHRLVWLVIEGSVSFDQTIFLTELRRFLRVGTFFYGASLRRRAKRGHLACVTTYPVDRTEWWLRRFRGCV